MDIHRRMALLLWPEDCNRHSSNHFKKSSLCFTTEGSQKREPCHLSFDSTIIIVYWKSCVVGYFSLWTSCHAFGIENDEKKEQYILCPIKEKNVRFPSKISFPTLSRVLSVCLTLIAGKMCESLCLIRYTTVTKNVKSVKGKERRLDFDFEVTS